MMRIYHELTLATFHVMERNNMVDQFIKPELGLFCSNTLLKPGTTGNTMMVHFGHSCDSATGLSKSGVINFSFSSLMWTTGTLVNLTFEDFYLEGRKLGGAMSIRQQPHQPSRNFKATASFDNFYLENGNGKRVTYSGRINSIVYLSDESLYSHEISGLLTGTFFDNEIFESNLSGPIRVFQQCYELGLTGFNHGKIIAQLDTRPVEILFEGPDFCIRDVTVKVGEESRKMPI